ncbi:MAG: winged helix-turn-helix transcriptional regulator [Erysipelotrichales bacterium]|nr:winged helix-turn-helix transcriptional regulator [Erysipelotrichales bacterium]
MQGIADLVLVSNQFSKVYQSFITRVAEKYGLSNIEVDVLLFLANNPTFDTAKDIVYYRHIAKSYVSKAIDLLLKKQLLDSYVDEHDHRITHLVINDSAREIINDGQNAQQTFVKVLHRNICSDDIERLTSIISQMNQNIKEYI